MRRYTHFTCVAAIGECNGFFLCVCLYVCCCFYGNRFRSCFVCGRAYLCLRLCALARQLLLFLLVVLPPLLYTYYVF